jgi:hypothetical protein
MNDIKITQWPVIIVANYRTGSSALVRILGRKYNLEVFSEPHLDSEQSHDRPRLPIGWYY